MSNCCPQLTGLAAQAEHPATVVTAYVAAFFPWGLMYAHDFISSRWRCVRDTRRAGWMHVVLALISLSYVLYYVHVQRLARDYKEMSAAIAAVMLTVLHIARTLWGLLQLQAIREWCKRAVTCLRRMGCDQKDRACDRAGNISVEDLVDSKMLVNQTLIDNRFSEADLPVAPRAPANGWIAGMKGLLSGQTEAWLASKTPLQCNVRWTAAFLCQFGSKWIRSCRIAGMEALADATELQVQALLHVTALISNGNNAPEPRSFLRPLNPFVTHGFRSTKETAFAYSSGLPEGMGLRNMGPFLHEALNAFDARALSTVQLTGAEAVKNISLTNTGAFMDLLSEQNEDWGSFQSHVEESDLWIDLRAPSVPLSVLFAQIGAEEEAELDEVFNGIPIPPKLCSSLLWTTKTMLQASVHVDNLLALEAGVMLHGQQAAACKSISVFFTQKNIEERLLQRSRGRFLGCIVEAVRTLLAQWLMSSTHKGVRVDWNPPLPRQMFTFPLSTQLRKSIQDVYLDKRLDPIQDMRGDKRVRTCISARMVWECQDSLYTDMTRRLQSPTNQSAHIMMLLILGFPSLTVTDKKEMGHSRSLCFIISPVHAPQAIDLLLKFNHDYSKAYLQLHGQDLVPHFDWEAWKLAVNGRLFGQHLRTGPKNVEPDMLRRPRDARWNTLNSPLVHISAAHSPVRLLKQSMWYWVGWPPHYSRIAQFELGQLVPQVAPVLPTGSAERSSDTAVQLHSSCDDQEELRKAILNVEKALDEIGGVFDDMRSASIALRDYLKEMATA